MLKTLKKIKKLRKLFPRYVDYLSALLKHDSLGASEKNQALLVESSYHILQQLNRQETQLQHLLQMTQKLDDANAKLRGQLEDCRVEIDRLLAARKSALVVRDEYLSKNPDVELMLYLVPFLPNLLVLDIGANVGEVSSRLLDAGCSVFAFEPDPRAFARLEARLGANKNCTLKACAIGSKNTQMQLHLVDEALAKNAYEEPSAYSSFVERSMPQGLSFVDAVKVPVRTLANLVEEKEIPTNASLVKIDTEGFEIEVINGMGTLRYPLVVAEFWARDFMLSSQKTSNSLDRLVSAMRERGYHFYIVIFLQEGNWEYAFYANWPKALDKAAGNVFFFQDVDLFDRALNWCQTHLAQADLPQG